MTMQLTYYNMLWIDLKTGKNRCENELIMASFEYQKTSNYKNFQAFILLYSSENLRPTTLHKQS